MDMNILSILQYNMYKTWNIIIVPLFKNKIILNIDIIALQKL